MRLKESRRVPMWNGPIECRMFRFDMIKGAVRDRTAKGLHPKPRTPARPMQVELRLAAEAAAGESARAVVVDTNVALDLLIFSDRAPPRCERCSPKGAWPG